MQLINRTAVTLIGERPYVDWMRSQDGDANRGALTVVRARSYGSVFLLPEFELEEDLQEWVEENFAWLFEFQLSAWTDDESSWPPNRTLTMFREWFRLDIHNVVIDAADTDLEGEEL